MGGWVTCVEGVSGKPIAAGPAGKVQGRHGIEDGYVVGVVEALLGIRDDVLHGEPEGD